MPRNRTARLAVLASPVQRSAPYGQRTSTALKRRIVIGVLVALSLALITGYFRESESGGLHEVQGAVATVLRPFQIGAERVARPFRDVYGYFAGLVEAKSDADRLRREIAQLRQQAVQNQFAAQERDSLREQLNYVGGSTFPSDYELISTQVIGQPPSSYEQWILIAVGTRHGVRDNSAVVDSQGFLIGKVTQVTPTTARVTLLTDEDSGVPARVLRRAVRGVIRPGQGGTLALDRVPKDEHVARGDRVVTAGYRLGALTGMYPKGISIGVVATVGQSDIDAFKSVQVAPQADFESLDDVIVLVRKRER